MDEQTTNSGSTAGLFDGVGTRQRRWFLVYLTVSVAVLSFAYGLVRGTLGHSAPAAEAAVTSGRSDEFEKLIFVRGMRVVPVGRDLTLNGDPAEMANFVAARDLRGLFQELVAQWESRGFKAVGVVTTKRGVAFAVDPATGVRYSALGNFVPPVLRRRMSYGYPVQGTLSAVSGAAPGTECGGGQCEVPGVPLREGGRAGVVFSSRDSGGRSSTSLYNNPGGLGENAGWYRDRLGAAGWSELPAAAGDSGSGGLALTLVRGREELTMLFSASNEGADERTTIVVALSRGAS